MKKIRGIIPTKRTVFFLFCAIAAVFGAWMPAAKAATAQQATDAQSARVRQSIKNKSGKELMAMINKPTNPVELLKNIKFAIENNLLLSEDICIDDNLNNLLGGTKVSWREYSSFQKKAEIVSLSDVFQRSFSGQGIIYERTRLDDKKVESSSGKLCVEISCDGYGDTRFTVEAVESVFGTDMQVVNPYTKPNRHLALIPTTHKLGNLELIYNIENPTSKTVISFLIKGNGIVKRAAFTQEEK
ncbi:MAG: hypothetical protein ABSC11_05520 [Smithella sp.]